LFPNPIGSERLSGRQHLLFGEREKFESNENPHVISTEANEMSEAERAPTLYCRIFLDFAPFLITKRTRNAPFYIEIAASRVPRSSQ
jgi:hypothetical protein